jgi:hypothetical protein
MSNIDKQTLPIIDMLNILPVDFNDKVKELHKQLWIDMLMYGESYYSIDKNSDIKRLSKKEFEELKLTKNENYE